VLSNLTLFKIAPGDLASRRDGKPGGIIMKPNYFLLIALLLVCGAVTAASDWVNSISKVVPENITLTDIEETSDFLRIVGKANNNDDISALMRAIEQAGLGSPELQQINRNDGISVFVLRVKAKR
jgi:hypothetical protein